MTAPGRLVATVLPPREGFSQQAVGAIGLLVHRLGQPGDVVVGQRLNGPGFSDRRFVPAAAALWPPVGRVDRYMAGVIRTLRRLRPDLVEVHNRANLARRAALAFPATPVVLFLHNDPQAMRSARTAAARAALLSRLTVVCVSNYLVARFMDGVDPSGPCPLLLPNAVELAALPPPLPAGAREKLVLFAGRIVANKGADCFVSACADALPRLPGWRACMIGADRFWPGGRQTSFERVLRPHAEAAGITMLGYRPHDEVLAAMARAAIVVVPSRWPEPFGLTALEALACGAALICSDRGGLPDVAGDAAVYVDPEKPGALAAAVERLAQNPAGRAALAEAGLARARLFDAPLARARLVELRARLVDT